MLWRKNIIWCAQHLFRWSHSVAIVKNEVQSYTFLQNHVQHPSITLELYIFPPESIPRESYGSPNFFQIHFLSLFKVHISLCSSSWLGYLILKPAAFENVHLPHVARKAIGWLILYSIQLNYLDKLPNTNQFFFL